MICLVEIRFVLVIHLRFFNLDPCTARVDERTRVRVTGLRVQGLPVYYLSFARTFTLRCSERLSSTPHFSPSVARS